MASHKSLTLFVVACFLVVSLNMCNAKEDERKEYVVNLKGTSRGPSHHLSLLKDIVPPSALANCLVMNFKSFDGFIARLTEREAERLASNKEVVMVVVLPDVDSQILPIPFDQIIRGLDEQRYHEEEELGIPLPAYQD